MWNWNGFGRKLSRYVTDNYPDIHLDGVSKFIKILIEDGWRQGRDSNRMSPDYVTSGANMLEAWNVIE
jgi:hypothetical protein